MASPERRFNRAAFFRDIGYRPHAGQLLVHRSSAPRRVVACGSRWGKTTLAAMEGLAAALEPRERSVGWVVAPNYGLADKVFREIVFVALSKLRHHVKHVSEHERVLYLYNLAGGVSEIRAKTADNPVSLLGEGLDWLIVDECARLKPIIWQGYLSARLVDKRGWALLISTPRGMGLYYELFRRGQGEDPDYESWTAPSWQNPILDRELIERERERLPERTFRQEFGGEFIEGSGSVFRFVREAATGSLKEYEKGASFCGGLDLAKREDFTVLTILDKQGEVCMVDRYRRQDWGIQIERVKAVCQRYSAWPVHVDSTGAGEPVYERLRSVGVDVKAYSFSAATKDALITNLSMLLEQRKLVLPRYELCPELIDELEAFEYQITEAGNVRTEAPSGMHDDCVISLGLAAWGLQDIQREYRFYSFPLRSARNDGWRPVRWNRFGVGW